MARGTTNKTAPKTPAKAATKTSKTDKAKAAAASTNTVKTVDGEEVKIDAVVDVADIEFDFSSPASLSESPTLQTSPYSPTSSSSLSQTTSSAIGNGFNFDALPLNLTANIPNFQGFMSVADLSSPDSFAAAGYKRVTDVQRDQDKVAYKEFGNYIANVGDGLTVLLATAKAAIQGAKLGQAQMQYATAREGIETERLNYNIQQSKTRQTQGKLNAEERKETHISDVNQVNDSLMTTQIEDLRLTLAEAQAKHANRQTELQALLAPYRTAQVKQA